jgi:hypothetical protein
MTTATLTFTLPTESREHECAVNGAACASLLFEALERARRRINKGAAIDPADTREPRPVTTAEREGLAELHRWLTNEINERELRTVTEAW